MTNSPHVIWISPTSQPFYRAKGEVRCRPGSVLPKLADRGLRINVLIPFDATLLPKTKPSPARTTRHTVQLNKSYPIEIIKLSRGSVSPGIFMVKLPPAEPALEAALFSKSALAFAQRLHRPVDLFHLIGWESALVPLYLEMEKGQQRMFRNTRSFLSVSSLHEQGNFSPSFVEQLGIPSLLFHPDGIEFFGRLSFLKAGLLFADAVGLVDGHTNGHARLPHRNGSGMEGVLDSLSFKIRRWASERSFRAHTDAYNELFATPAPEPILPKLLERLHPTVEEATRFIESWGPLPPDRYHHNRLEFMLQSPVKTYAHWEWAHNDQRDYGVLLEDVASGSRTLLSRGLPSLGDYWIGVDPDREYVVELVGWSERGAMTPLLRSRPLRTPRTGPSSNRDAVFIDVRSRRRFGARADETWDEWLRRFRVGSGSAAWEWESRERKITPIEIPSSIEWVGSSAGSSFQLAAKKNSK